MCLGHFTYNHLFPSEPNPSAETSSQLFAVFAENPKNVMQCKQLLCSPFSPIGLVFFSQRDSQLSLPSFILLKTRKQANRFIFFGRFFHFVIGMCHIFTELVVS